MPSAVAAAEVDGAVEASTPAPDEKPPPPKKPAKPDFRRCTSPTLKAAQTKAYDAALVQYFVDLRLHASSTKAARPKLERDVRGLPPDGYVCRVCNLPGHYVVNCGVVRSAGPQDLFGRQRYRTYTKRAAKGEPTSLCDTSVCGEAVEPPPVATGPWSMKELDMFPMRETCLQPNALVRATHRALPHCEPSSRCTAESTRHVWHRSSSPT